MPQVNEGSALTKLLQDREEEVGQRKGSTIKARLSHAGKLVRKFEIRGYIFDINGRLLRQADKGRSIK